MRTDPDRKRRLPAPAPAGHRFRPYRVSCHRGGRRRPRHRVPRADQRPAHMGADVLGLGMALAAIQLAKRPAAGGRPYGTYRLEVMAAVINGVLLFGVGFYVLYEAVQRSRNPPEVAGMPMLVVASIGLVINIISFKLLTAGSKESLNLKGRLPRGAPPCSALSGHRRRDQPHAHGIPLHRRDRRGRDRAAHPAPHLEPDAPGPADPHGGRTPGIDVDKATAELAAVPGVGEVHDLHIWTLTSGMEVATVHIVADDDATWHRVLDSTRQILTENCAVTHPTIQLEPADHVERTADSDRGVCNGFGPPGPRCCTQVCGRARGQGVHTSARRLQKAHPTATRLEIRQVKRRPRLPHGAPLRPHSPGWGAARRGSVVMGACAWPLPPQGLQARFLAHR